MVDTQTGLNRRGFLRLGGYTMASGALRLPKEQTGSAGLPKFVLFDAFPIFDPRSVKTLVASAVPDKANELFDLWRSRIFEYQWLRALSGKYADFESSVEQALQFAARSLQVTLMPSDAAGLVNAFSNLSVWPDVGSALPALKSLGVKLGFLSNMTERMLHTNLQRSGIAQHFDVVLSTDRVRSFKPDPRAYNLACKELMIEKEEMLFAAFAGWDAAGAQWFGLPTYWVNRMHAAPEFGVETEGEGSDLRELVKFVYERAGRSVSVT